MASLKWRTLCGPRRFVCKAALLVVVGLVRQAVCTQPFRPTSWIGTKSEEVNGDRSDERQRSCDEGGELAQFTATGLRCWVGTRKHMCRSNRAANPVLLG